MNWWLGWSINNGEVFSSRNTRKKNFLNPPWESKPWPSQNTGHGFDSRWGPRKCFFWVFRLENTSPLFIPFSFNYLPTGRLREVKNEKKNQIFSSKSGRGRLREVVALERFQWWWFDLESFGILEIWSLRRGGRNRRFDCIVITQQ